MQRSGRNALFGPPWPWVGMLGPMSEVIFCDCLVLLLEPFKMSKGFKVIGAAVLVEIRYSVLPGPELAWLGPCPSLPFVIA